MISLSELLNTIKPYVLGWIAAKLWGSAFPTTAAFTGQPFYRTDTMRWYFWNGSRWLGIRTPLMHLVSFTNSATINVGYTYMVDTTYLDTWKFTINVATTNNSSNYWTVKLTDGSNVFASFATNASSPGVNITQTITSFSPNPVGSTNTIYVRLEKTGTPGTIDYYGGLRIRESGS